MRELLNTAALMAVLAALVLSALFSTGCSLFTVHGQGHVKATYGDKVLVDRQVEFDSLEEMPGAMRELGGALGETTRLLAEKLVEAPPPGQVKLADLDPGLASFENDESINFLLAAKNAGEPLDFSYVQIGVPSYDQFFKQSAELYALMYQTKQTIYNLRAFAAVRARKTELPTDELRRAVDSALVAPFSPQLAGADLKLRNLASITATIAGAARNTVTRVQQLVASGQQLVTAAPSSITNPKTVLHLDLILKGLKQSLEMVGRSGQMLVEMVPQLAGF